LATIVAAYHMQLFSSPFLSSQACTDEEGGHTHTPQPPAPSAEFAGELLATKLRQVKLDRKSTGLL